MMFSTICKGFFVSSSFGLGQASLRILSPSSVAESLRISRFFNFPSSPERTLASEDVEAGEATNSVIGGISMEAELRFSSVDAPLSLSVDDLREDKSCGDVASLDEVAVAPAAVVAVTVAFGRVVAAKVTDGIDVGSFSCCCCC